MDTELRTILDAFDEFVAAARNRIIAAHTKYSDAWRWRDNLQDLKEESEDAFAYGFYDWLRVREKRRNETP